VSATVSAVSTAAGTYAIVDHEDSETGVVVMLVDTERDADGVLYLVSDGIRYALAYGPEDRVCTLVNPSYIPCLSG